MNKIKYGFIGFGGIAENRIAREGFALDNSRFQEHPDAELIGATDINESRKEAALSLGLKWYDSYSDMLKDSMIQAVFIAANNLSHAGLAELALKANKPCLLEKPFATNVNDARQIQALARKNHLSIAVDHMMVHNAYNRKARELIERGLIGAVNDICLHMEFLYGSTPAEEASWRCVNPEELGGPIGDVASHCLYMAEFLLDSPIVSVACVYTPKTIDIQVENGAFIQFRLKNQIQGTVRVAFNQPRGSLESTLTNLGYEIYGSKGILRGYGTLFQLSGHDGEPIAIRLDVDSFDRVQSVKITNGENIYQAVISEHARSIREGKPLDASDAIHNLELILACHESARDNGKEILV